MFLTRSLKYQKATISNNQVAFDVEEVDIELSDVTDFENKIKELRNVFYFEVEDERIEAKKQQLNENAAENTLVKLEKLIGWVLIEGNFKIETDENCYILKMLHPVSNYLKSNKKVQIYISLPKDKIEESFSGNYKSSIGSSINLNVYAQVWRSISRSEDNWNIVLTPLAIY